MVDRKGPVVHAEDRASSCLLCRQVVNQGTNSAIAKEDKSRSVPARMIAIHTLLLDLARVAEARAMTLLLPRLLEEFWAELAEAELPVPQAELLLHRLSSTYSHGTLRCVQAERLVECLADLGIHAALDPLAHTGFHAKVLCAHGLCVEAADLAPSMACWGEVTKRTVSETQWGQYGEGWALFLSWLPHWSEIGDEALKDFRGDAVVVLGDNGDWTATEHFRRRLSCQWSLHTSWSTEAPWPRVDERISIFVRRHGHSADE